MRILLIEDEVRLAENIAAALRHALRAQEVVAGAMGCIISAGDMARIDCLRFD